MIELDVINLKLIIKTGIIIMETENNNVIHNPHDKLFFGSLRNSAIAKDALSAYLPVALLAKMDLTKMVLYKTKLVSGEMKEFQADIIYEIPFEKTEALLLFHCEQESKPKKKIPLKIWQYLLLVLMEHLENYPNKPLPVPFPIIIYTGEKKFNVSTDLFDLFGENKKLAKTYFLQPIKLVDVCRLKDEDIQKKALFGLTEFAFKYKKGKDFERFLKTVMPWLHKVEVKIGDDYVKLYLKYVMNVFPEASYDIFEKITHEYLSEEVEKETMTIAEQLHEKGMQKGIQQGMQQEKYFIAKNLIMNSVSDDLIIKSTGLSVCDIQQLKQELTINETEH